MISGLCSDSLTCLRRCRVIEELLLKPYWVIDILPEQVTADSARRFARVEGVCDREEPGLAVLEGTHCAACVHCREKGGAI